MAETLDEAIREAKIAAGLNPDEKHAASEFYMHLGDEWEMLFWQRCLTMVFAEELGLNAEDFQ